MIKEIAFICSILFAPYLKDNCFKTNFFESLSQANFNINQADFVSTDVEETIYELVDPGITSNPNLDIDYRTNIYHPIQGEDIPTNSFLGDEFIPDKEYMIKYFKNLQNNKIGNYLGVCGYTALGMFLSYYDTYWNDDFIEEKYESAKTNITSTNFNTENYHHESPGILDTFNDTNVNLSTFRNEIRSEGYTDETSDAFKERMDDKIMSVVYSEINSDSFIGKLFQLSINNGFIQPHYANDGNKTIISPNYVSGLGVSYDVTDTNLRSYLACIPSLSDHISIITSRIRANSDDENYQSEKQRIRSEIVEIVKSGRPVLMGGNTSAGGHAVVAYRYDETTDKLYGNMGWDAYIKNDDDLDSFFTVQISDYWALKFNSLETRQKTNHYVFSDYQAYYSPNLDYVFHEINPWNNNFYEGYARYETSSTIQFDGINSVVTSKRKRCALIQQNYTVLSTRRYEDGGGIAYLEYSFPTDVKILHAYLSWWSNKEFVTANNSSYTIDYLNENNEYETIYDLWDDTTLSTDKSSPSLYILECQTMFEHLGFMVMQKIQNIIEIKGGWSYKI